MRLSLLLLLPLWLYGCGEQVEVVELGPLEQPENHDNATTPETSGPRQVQIPDAIAGRYSSITIAVRRPGKPEPHQIQVPLGEEIIDGNSRFAAKDYLPAFMISQGSITSDGVEEKNPAVHVTWFEGKQAIFDGWLFRDYPSLNPPLVEGFQLELLSAQ